MLRRKVSTDYVPPQSIDSSREIAMAEKTVRGRFVWHELVTPDTAGAHGFYTKVLGWKTQPWEQDPSYSMFAAGSGPLGGSVAKQDGTPHWLPYIATDDIDATVQKATSLGGRVTKEITSMSADSKYAQLTDPQGGAFGVYWSTQHSGRGEGAPKRGEFSWQELATGDYQAAFEFYSALFGWEKSAEHDMGPIGKYALVSHNGRPIVGMFNKTAEMQGPPFWLSYVRVKDVHQSVKKITSARGTLLMGPAEVPGGDWIAQFIDPYGAMFAVHAVSADVKSAAEPAADRAAAETAPAAKPEAPKKVAAKPAATRAAKKAAPAAKKSAAKKPAAKKAAAKKPAAKKPAAKKPAAKKAAAKKSAASKKATKKKAAPRKQAAAKKKTRAAQKSAKRPARKAGKQGGKKKVTKRSSGGKKKTAKKPRKGK
jgi:predicted enzyme related to lactoylglutathione lyase